MEESVKFDEELRGVIEKSVKTLAKAVKSTLGPSGTNALVLSPIKLPLIVNDGVTVAKSFSTSISEKYPDTLETKIIKLLNTVSQNTDDIVGDGPQPLYSKILTPTGWTTMGQLKKGDLICGVNNTFQKVLDVYPKGKKQIYEVTFSDKRKVECCEDHLWSVNTNRGIFKTLPLKEIIKNYKNKTKNGYNEYKYYTPATSVEFKEQKVILDSYTLGVLLGDGSLSALNSKAGYIEISLGKKKEHIIEKLKLPKGYFLKTTWVESKNYFRVKIKNEKNVPSFHSVLKEIGLLGKKSDNKFIPKTYLYNSKKIRESLLQGLMDADGYKTKRGLFEYSTTSVNLAKDVVELFRSLGKSLNIKLHNRENDKNSYSNTPIYRLNEHVGYKYGHKIVDITPIDKYVDMQCIKVSNEDSLYITDDFVVTHNTSTSITLAEAIILEGLKYIKAGFSPIDVVKGIHAATKEILKNLEKVSVDVLSNEDLLLQVSSISANNDKNLGKTISEAFLKVGVNGQIEIKDSNSQNTYIDILNGMKYNSGFESNVFINTDKSVTKFDDSRVLIYEGKLDTIEPIIDILKELRNKNENLLIIADDYSREAINDLANNKIQNQLKVCAVKSPGYGNLKETNLEDIAFMTNSKIISERLGIDVSESDYSFLGYASKITVNENSFTIVANNVDESLLNEKISNLKQQLKTVNKSEKSEITDRLAKLSNGVAVMYVGGDSPVEITEKKYRAEDAINATRASLEEGVLPGGGVTLLRLSNSMTLPKLENESQEMGFKVLKNALKAPIKTIVENCGENGEVILNKVLENEEFNFGYDAKTKEFKNLLEAGVLDPKKVTKTALMNASSIAQMILTINVAVY